MDVLSAQAGWIKEGRGSDYIIDDTLFLLFLSPDISWSPNQ